MRALFLVNLAQQEREKWLWMEVTQKMAGNVR